MPPVLPAHRGTDVPTWIWGPSRQLPDVVRGQRKFFLLWWGWDAKIRGLVRYSSSHTETWAKTVVHSQWRVGSSIWAKYYGDGAELPNTYKFLVSTLQLFPVAFHGKGRSCRHVWRSSPAYLVQAAMVKHHKHFTLGRQHSSLLGMESYHSAAKEYGGFTPRLEKGVTSLFHLLHIVFFHLPVPTFRALLRCISSKPN